MVTDSGGAKLNTEFRTLDNLLSSSELRDIYSQASPFPHAVLDGLLTTAAYERCIEEFESLDQIEWKNYLHVNERKFANQELDSWGPSLQQVTKELTSAPFIAWLEEVTGIDGLMADPHFDGGGLHRSIRGGFLNIHADFTAHHAEPQWQRRVNLLLYLNREWSPEFGGDLELWDTSMKSCVDKISPIGNRVVIFTTSPDAYHGHPTPLNTPVGVARRSLALYYFTRSDEVFVRSTNYQGRPEDGWKKIFIKLDSSALRVYDFAKHRLRFNDKVISSVLGKMFRPFKRSRRSQE